MKQRLADYVADFLVSRGITDCFSVTGGGAMLRGLGRFININTEIPVYIAENPIDCVASGAGRAVDFMLNRRGKGIFGR